MDKFNLLLNENTIVDFKLLWKLSKRYRSHLIFSVLLCVTIFSLQFYLQPVRFSVSVPLKTVSNHTVATDLSALLPVDNSAGLSLNELKISLESATFLKSYVDLVIKDQSFNTLNFGAINGTTDVRGKEFKLICKNKFECVHDKVTKALGATFNVDQGLTENRFTLTINAKDKQTAQKVTPILLKAIEAYRIQAKQYLVQKEIVGVGNLMSESRLLIQQMDGYKALEDQERLQNNILDLKEKIRHLQNSISIESANVSSLESRLNQNRKTTRRKTGESRENYERVQKLQVRLIEVKQNIAILTNVPEEKRSVGDHLIIKQLKEERTALLAILPDEFGRKTIEVNENFLDGQINKTGDFEFDFTVAKNKLDALNRDYEAVKNELNTLLQQKLANENKVVSMKADLEFLKSLENKQMSLKLLNATLTSDLFYEDGGANAREYRQATVLRIMLFSFFTTFFIYVLSLVVRFFVDDKIYGADEMRSHLKGLDFIGEVPSFD